MARKIKIPADLPAAAFGFIAILANGGLRLTGQWVFHA